MFVVSFNKQRSIMFYKSLTVAFLFTRFALSQDSMAHHNHAEEMVRNNGDTLMQNSMSEGIYPGKSIFIEASGTSWLPQSSATGMTMAHSGDWMLMAHGNVYVRYTNQGGKRGSDQLSIPNWFMVSARRDISENQNIVFRGMLSFDRLFDGGNGYPLLLQSGETWNGESLYDRQHPHDLFAEVSATYGYSFAEETGAVIYFAFPGEPALGPPAFMHRPAAQFNPDAPIGHHWQDATHISFGVATTGFVFGPIKLEGSVFNGREPDENRYNFDSPRYDSYSGRVSYNLGDDFSLQMSYGFLRNPEGHGDDVNRVSTSVLYSTVIDGTEIIHASAIFGQNSEHHMTVRSYLLELTYITGDVGLYGRHESIEKPRSDLGIMVEKERKELLHQITAGANTRIAQYANHAIRAGVQGTISVVTAFLEPLYGKNPVSYQIYLQLQY
jgi:hypothetical protein